MKEISWITLLLTTIILLDSGCSPEVGSKAWCKQMQEKPKGEWTANEAADYARYCVFR